MAKNYCIAGMECTGSTLVWQFVTEISGKKAGKAHSYKKSNNNIFFITYRDPRDVLCSFTRRQHAGHIKKYGIEAALIHAFNVMFEKFKRHEDLIKYHDESKRSDRIHLIKYENFFCGNEDKLLELILKKMNKSLNNEKKWALIKKYSIEKNKKRSEKFSGFGQYDKKTYIHGNHISANGKVGVWEEIFTEKVKELVKKKLGKFLIDFGYEKDLDW